jgi:hypothetical protein
MPNDSTREQGLEGRLICASFRGNGIVFSFSFSSSKSYKNFRDIFLAIRLSLA